MSRKIRFRAWNKNKKIMVYKNEDNSAIYLDGWYASDVQILNQTLNNDRTNDVYEFMQSLGLHDRNGKEIYEGDIIHIDLEGLDNFNYLIQWSENNLRYYLYSIEEKDLNKIGGILEAHLESLISQVEVIGNKYQNLKLGKEKE